MKSCLEFIATNTIDLKIVIENFIARIQNYNTKFYKIESDNSRAADNRSGKISKDRISKSL